MLNVLGLINSQYNTIQRNENKKPGAMYLRCLECNLLTGILTLSLPSSTSSWRLIAIWREKIKKIFWKSYFNIFNKASSKWSREGFPKFSIILLLKLFYAFKYVYNLLIIVIWTCSYRFLTQKVWSYFQSCNRNFLPNFVWVCHTAQVSFYLAIQNRTKKYNKECNHLFDGSMFTEILNNKSIEMRLSSPKLLNHSNWLL